MAATREAYGYVYGNPLNYTDPSGLGIDLPGGFCIQYGPSDDSCNTTSDLIRDEHPEVAQGIVDYSSGALNMNPITAVTNATGATDTDQYANTCSWWYRGGQASMLAVDLVAGGDLAGLGVKSFRYPKAGGGGVALLRNGSQIVRADYHLVKVRQSFRFLPRSWVGEQRMLPHLHFWDM